MYIVPIIIHVLIMYKYIMTSILLYVYYNISYKRRRRVTARNVFGAFPSAAAAAAAAAAATGTARHHVRRAVSFALAEQVARAFFLRPPLAPAAAETRQSAPFSFHLAPFRNTFARAAYRRRRVPLFVLNYYYYYYSVLAAILPCIRSLRARARPWPPEQNP